MLKNPAVRMSVLGIALIGSAAAFYFMSPLFMSDGMDNLYPTLAYMPTHTPAPPTATPTPTAIPTDTEAPQPLSLASGAFYDIVHQGSGTAVVYQLGDQLTLNLQGFEVEEGPDLHVYLYADENIPTQSGVDLPGEYVDLGALQSPSGDQSYIVPPDLSIADYHSVVIWCVPYSVPFSGAILQAP